MNKIKTLLFLFFTINLCSGQVATIKDSDGWTNVRVEPNGKSEIAFKVVENQVFWYDTESFENKKEWIEIFLPSNKYSLGCISDKPIKGYVHISRVFPIDEMTKTQPNELVFRYKVSSFEENSHIISKDKDNWISEINGRHPWGVDGGLPKTQIDKIDVKINGKVIKISDVYFLDIFECTNGFNFYKNKNDFFVQQWNSDGAGSYEIVWVINEKGLKQRIIGAMY